MKYLITGGTGFLGKNLVENLLSEGHEVIILSRKARKGTQPGLSYQQWDGKSISSEVGPVDVVINLAGASLADKKWTDEYKKVISGSRINAAQACVQYILQQKQKPKVFLAGSAIGYYGGNRPGEVNETSEAGTDYLAKVVKDWEDASKGAGIRTVILRTGVVLGSDDGPLVEMMRPFKFFAGGPLASGRQYLSWIHVQDWVKAIRFLVDQEAVEGPVNITAPEPVRNELFSETLARVMCRPNLFRVPKFALEMLLGEQSIIVWGSTKARPEVLEKSGFEFKWGDLESGLKDLIA